MILESFDYQFLPRRRSSFLSWHLAFGALSIVLFIIGNYVLPAAYCFIAGIAFYVCSGLTLLGFLIYFGCRHWGLFLSASVLLLCLQIIFMPAIVSKSEFLSQPDWLGVLWFVPIAIANILSALANSDSSEPDLTFSAKAVDIKYINDIAANGSIICRDDAGIYVLGHGNWAFEAYIGQALELHTALAIDGRQHPMYFRVDGVEEPIRIECRVDASYNDYSGSSSGEVYHDNWLA